MGYGGTGAGALSAEQMAVMFTGLSRIGGLGGLSPRSAFSGIDYLARHAAEVGFTPEGAEGTDPYETMIDMYLQARDDLATRNGLSAGARAREERDAGEVEALARMTGRPAAEVAGILRDRSEEREAVEARASLYRRYGG